MGSLLLAITAIFAAAFVMQTANSIPAEEENDLCPCTREYDPICGSDQHTYSNKCLFDCEKKKRNPNLEIQSYGVCGGQSFSIPIDELNFKEEDYQYDYFTGY